MDHTLKKNIRLLVLKLKGSIEFLKNSMIIRNEKVEIELSDDKKGQYNVKYNLNNSNVDETLFVKSQDLYHVLIGLLQHQDLHLPELTSGPLLTLDHFLEFEGKRGLTEVEKLKKDLKQEHVVYRHLGGNVIEAEYYMGVLILQEDLSFGFKANIISF